MGFINYWMPLLPFLTITALERFEKLLMITQQKHKTVAHLIPDNVTAVMTPVLMFVLMFAIDYRLGILLILTTVIGVLQYRKMSGGTEFLSGYSAALQKMSAATVEYVRGMQIIKIFGVTVQYYKTLISSGSIPPSRTLWKSKPSFPHFQTILRQRLSYAVSRKRAALFRSDRRQQCSRQCVHLRRCASDRKN